MWKNLSIESELIIDNELLKQAMEKGHRTNQKNY